MPSGPQCADPMTAGSQRAGCDSCRPEARHISPQAFRYHRDASTQTSDNEELQPNRLCRGKLLGCSKLRVDLSELQVASLPIINIMSGTVLNVRSTWVIGCHCGGSMNSIVSPCGPTAYITRVPTFAPPAIG